MQKSSEKRSNTIFFCSNIIFTTFLAIKIAFFCAGFTVRFYSFCFLCKTNLKVYRLVFTRIQSTDSNRNGDSYQHKRPMPG